MAIQVTSIGANLFALAAQYLSDATQWIVIAQANGLTDPFIAGQVTLIIPTGVPATGGIPTQ